MESILTVQKGRSATIEIVITDNSGDFVTIQSGEKILFGVKKRESDSNYAIYKELTILNISDDRDSYLLELDYNDTDIASGYYHYDIAYQNDDGLFPIIEYTPFVVKKAVISEVE